ncbi:MAG: hypothetical protein AB7E29_07220 [Xanthobacter sp.]
MASLNAIQDEAMADAARIQLTLNSAGNQALTSEILEDFSSAARDGLRMKGAATAATICALSLNVSKSRTTKFT